MDEEETRLERHLNSAEYWVTQADQWNFPDAARAECLQLANTHAHLASALAIQPDRWLERIVRELADGPFPEDSEHGDCKLCGAYSDLYHLDRSGGKMPYPTVDHLDKHESDCPWRMAREWVAENPAK